MANAVDFFSSIGSNVLSRSETKVIFRSNLTPDITIDVSKLSAGGEPKEIVSSPTTGVMALIRPQATLTGMGLTKNIAPYGTPVKNAWVVAVAALLISGILGSKIAWYLCKKVPGR